MSNYELLVTTVGTPLEMFMVTLIIIVFKDSCWLLLIIDVKVNITDRVENFEEQRYYPNFMSPT